MKSSVIDQRWPGWFTPIGQFIVRGKVTCNRCGARLSAHGAALHHHVTNVHGESR